MIVVHYSGAIRSVRFSITHSGSYLGPIKPGDRFSLKQEPRDESAARLSYPNLEARQSHSVGAVRKPNRDVNKLEIPHGVYRSFCTILGLIGAERYSKETSWM
ncbi:hypothetical protein CSKR_202119 [Clonorchis sinensis]|uniref:Uncharacterized protein n=1 Tax=Clonorchis sinensis TaxID=79923 RepID=A0A8T1LWW6_CLOSI|nr:hypothetical protein CSKR_202119 [Clonorchis sinensis]